MAYRELVVMTRPAVVRELTPGHAMIAISSAGIGEEAWGFYKNGIRDEIFEGGWHRYTRSTVIEINDTQYAALKAEIATWKSAKYWLGYRDCTDFALAVCQKAGIRVPADSLFPGNLGDAFIKLHGESWGRCLSRDARSRSGR